MITIIPYQDIHQNDIDEMINQIALEFDEQIFPKPTKETPIVPNNYWVALNNKKVVGTIGIIVIKNEFGVLKKMMIKKSFRGKRLGISQLLLETAINCCKQNNIAKIYLGTMNQFKAAQLFYEKKGFKRVAEKELPLHFPSNPLDTVFFKQELL